MDTYLIPYLNSNMTKTHTKTNDVTTNQTQLHIFWIGINYTLVRFLFLTLNRYSKIGQYTRTLAHEHLGLGKSGPDSLVQTPIDRTLGKTSEATPAVGPAVQWSISKCLGSEVQ